MSLSLTAEQKSIIKIFKIEEQYLIPAYQRPYSWGYDACLTLNNDIFKAYKDEEEYFIGNIIISRSDNNKDILEVIDGQQRLTTLILLIKVLSIFSPDLKPLQDSLIKENWETGEQEARIVSNVFETSDSIELQYVLNLKENDFEKIFLDNQDKNGNFTEKFCKSRLTLNIMYFYIWIKTYNEKNGDLRDFTTFFLKNIYLLPIELNGKTSEEASEKALKIFETINNRGMNLDDSDIFKSKLYEKAKKVNEEDRFIKGWKDLKNSCEVLNIEIVDLFKYYSHIIRGENSKTTSEINLREFFTRLEYSPFTLKNYDAILDELFIILEALEYIQKEMNQTSILAKWLQLIAIYTNQYPKNALVVYLFIELKNNNCVDLNKLLDFLRKIIRYSYYQGSTTKIKFKIYNIIVSICHNKTIESYIKDEVPEQYFNYLGGLKNGYALLCFYLESKEALGNYNIDKIVSYKDEKNLNDSWTKEKIKECDNSLGNFVILDIAKRNMPINKKATYYESSNLSSVKNLSTKLNNFSYDDLKLRDKKLKIILHKFFKGEIY